MDKTCKIRKTLAFITLLLAAAMMVLAFTGVAKADTPKLKSKFYDCSDQLIDGEVRKPTALYLDVRQKVKFQRLLRLKRDFKRDLMKTTRERVFK